MTQGGSALDLLFDAEEDDVDGADAVAGPSAKLPSDASASASDARKAYFAKELRCLMYAFGDDRVPYAETVDVLDELVVEFVREMTAKCMDVGKPGKVALEDLWYLIRRDAKKYARVKELLAMSEELRRARKAFDDTKY